MNLDEKTNRIVDENSSQTTAMGWISQCRRFSKRFARVDSKREYRTMISESIVSNKDYIAIKINRSID